MRAISQTFIDDLKNGVLKPFLDDVRVDDALCLEIRKDYINIYYRGGNLFKISSTKTKGYNIFFDLSYCTTPGVRERLETLDPYDYAAWMKETPSLKAEMDRFLSAKPKLEREFQQLIERENNTSSIALSSDYYIADIEYANAVNQSRFDMLAIKWKPEKGRGRNDPAKASLSFIEVKYGDGALKGSSGVQKHVADLSRFLRNETWRKGIGEEVSNLFNQKLELGLIRGANKVISIGEGLPFELVLLVGNHNPRSRVLDDELRLVMKSRDYQQLLSQNCEIKIAKASLLGYGLYDHEHSMIPLGEYLERYSS